MLQVIQEVQPEGLVKGVQEHITCPPGPPGHLQNLSFRFRSG